ncbi:GumC family protein [Gloeothece verrucosa]|uniref:ATPase involved in chromosome partitioning-like protein n=1 Tax=Gloeothece verrucosa (strain PCC 7822) TaxID=497965 RepID=E0UI73_GLOV7|nr:tyrosine-protein kinase domain-containing protein [Gloeothece verrucosa]ADN15725.1 ATPase involved in chromosome partitioning-like protein [Gloeothece verrucosa PCC 7822]
MAPPIVKRFLISLNQNKWLGIFVIIASMGGAVVFAMLPPPPPPKPVYQANGRLDFRTPPPSFTTAGAAIQQQNRAITPEVLMAPRVLESVAKKLQLTDEQIIDIRDNKLKIILPETTAQAANKNQNQNQSTPNQNQAQNSSPTQGITLEYTDEQSATRAELILQTFMNEMIDYSRWLNTAQLREKIAALNKRLGQVQQDLTKAEKQYYDYISQQGTDLIAVEDGSLVTAITNSQQQRRQIQLGLQEIQGQIDNLSKQLGLTPQQAYTQTVFSADPILANLRANLLNTELQLERLQRELRPEHPTIIQLLKEKQVNETLLQQRALELIGKDGVLAPLPGEIRKESNLDTGRLQLANQLLALDTQRQGLLRQLASVMSTERELQKKYKEFPQKRLKLTPLQQAMEFQKTIYNNVLNSLTDARAAESETESSLVISQEPFVPPIKPYKAPQKNVPLIILAGAGIGVFASAGVIFLLAMIDDKLYSPQEIRDALTEREVLILGQLPLIENLNSDEPREAILLEEDYSTYLPFYERLRSNIRRFGSASSKVIIVTSIINEEGKTANAYNLAIASAQAGKRTLLVEADLRSPSKSSILQVNPDPESGLEPLRYYAARTEAISLVPAVENLYILPSAGPQKRAAAIIESSELQLLLKDARGRFDMVVIDTPSLSKCNDALLLEPLTDGLILVTRPGITRSSFLSEAIEQLAEAEISVLGAVINCVENLVTPEGPAIPALETELGAVPEEEANSKPPLKISA